MRAVNTWVENAMDLSVAVLAFSAAVVFIVIAFKVATS